MKTLKRLLPMACALLMATALFAQSEPVSPQPVADDDPIWNDPLLDLGGVILGAQYMVQELGLTEEQGERLRNIEETMNGRMAEVGALDWAERETQEKELLNERNEMVAAVLTKDQVDRMNQLKRNMLRDTAAKLAVQRAVEAEKGLGKQVR